MGDVAILMKNAFNPTQTVLCNGVINLFSLVGLFIGLMLTELNEVATNYVLIFVAGNFIFIAADIWKNLFRNKELWKNLVELSGIVIGVAIMYWILELESQGGCVHSHGGHSHGGHSHGGHSHGHHHHDEL
jgi:zinc transporter ZupT